MVPPSEGFVLVHVAPGPKQLPVVPDAGHVAGYRWTARGYERTVLGFLSGAQQVGGRRSPAAHLPVGTA